jgi:putative colanic acid biosynthesis glycosyltransferase WcaI
MKILILTLNYAPEQTGYGPRVAFLAEYLAGQGHSSTVLTGFPFMPYWSRYPEYKGKFVMEEHHKGWKVTRLSHFIPSRPKSTLQRLLLEGSFCFMAALALICKWKTRWDIVVYIGTHPSIAMLGGVIANIRRLPYVVKITDLASDLASQVGIVKLPWLHKFFNKFEYAAFRRSQGAIVLCEGFQEALQAHGYPPENIRVIFNSVDLNMIRPLGEKEGFRAQNNLSPDDFVLLYSGSMSRKQGLLGLIEAARLLKPKYPRIKWVLVGDGELKPKLEGLIVEYGLTQAVKILPLQPEDKMSAMFSAANILLLPQLADIKDTVIPGKLLTYMAAGQPILASVNSENQTARMLRKAGGGVFVPPENPRAMARVIEQFVKVDTRDLVTLGQHNRIYAEQYFDNRKNLAAHEAFLLQVVRNANI